MCSTCDYIKFEVIDDETIGQSIGFGDLQIQCDKKHQNYKVAIKDQPKSFYKLYYCPTCGRKFY